MFIKALFISLLVLSASALADPILIASETWENYTEKNGKGLYFDILTHVFKDTGEGIKIIHVPFSRAVALVIEGDADVVPAVCKDLYGSSVLYSETVLSIESVDVVIPKALANNWQGIDSLIGKSVVAYRGYAFDRYLPDNLNYFEIDDVEAMLKMLQTGRVDAVLDYESNIRSFWDTTKLGQTFVIKRAIIRNNLHVAFTNSQRGQQIKKVYDLGFIQALKNGEIKALFNQYNVNLATYPSDQP